MLPVRVSVGHCPRLAASRRAAFCGAERTLGVQRAEDAKADADADDGIGLTVVDYDPARHARLVWCAKL